MIKYYYALVVQWIERQPPKLKMWVRLPPSAVFFGLWRLFVLFYFGDTRGLARSRYTPK